MLGEPEFRRLLQENDQNTWPGCEETLRSRDRALALLAETFGIQPQDPYAAVRAMQAVFDPSVLVFSDEYYDVLGLENPRTPEEQTERCAPADLEHFS